MIRTKLAHRHKTAFCIKAHPSVAYGAPLSSRVVQMADITQKQAEVVDLETQIAVAHKEAEAAAEALRVAKAKEATLTAQLQNLKTQVSPRGVVTVSMGMHGCKWCCVECIERNG